MTWLISIMILSVWANSVDPHQTAPSASSGRTTLFKNNIVKILGHLQLFSGVRLLRMLYGIRKKRGVVGHYIRGITPTFLDFFALERFNMISRR